VLAAASEALAVLLARSPSELLLEEAGCAAASLAGPLPWRASLRRLSRGGVWDTVQALVAAAQQAEVSRREAAKMGRVS
jgi:hypothetical protein